MPRFRFTLRRMMVAVLTLAVALRLAIVAVRIYGQPNVQTLSHLRRFSDDREPFVYSHATGAEQIWAEFWRRSVGLAWPGGFNCPCKAKQEAEMGKATEDVETSHDLEALERRMSEM